MQMNSRNKSEKKKNPAAVALSKLGASKGGKARMALLTPKERSAHARMAVMVRWAKKKKRSTRP